MKTEKILFKRTGENVGTIDPVAAYVAGMVDLDEKRHYCMSWDFDMPVLSKVYEVRDVQMPDWMDPQFWVTHSITLKYTWGLGADKEWSEEITRGLMRLEGVVRLIAIKLLRTKTFRSAFRKAMLERLIDWCRDSHGYHSPWTANMIRAMSNQHICLEYKRLSDSLYHSRW